MPYDPFSVDRYHEEIRQKIENREPGYAQSEIGEVLVSFKAHGFPRGLTHGRFLSQSEPEILDEMIVDVARGEGHASDGTFRRNRIDFMISDREAYADHWKKKHAEAALLRDFYLNGPGQSLLC